MKELLYHGSGKVVKNPCLVLEKKIMIMEQVFIQRRILIKQESLFKVISHTVKKIFAIFR